MSIKSRLAKLEKIAASLPADAFPSREEIEASAEEFANIIVGGIAELCRLFGVPNSYGDVASYIPTLAWREPLDNTTLDYFTRAVIDKRNQQTTRPGDGNGRGTLSFEEETHEH